MFTALDRFGGRVTAEQQAVFNKISTNNSNGYVGDYLNSLAIVQVSSNAISIDSGILSIQGFRFANDGLQTFTVNVTPPSPIPFQMVAVFSHYVSSENDTIEIITRPVQELRREPLFEGSDAVYEVELAEFTMTASGIADFAVTLEKLTYSDKELDELLDKVINAENTAQQAAEDVADLEVSNAQFKSETTARVDELEKQIVEKQGTVVSVGDTVVNELRFISDPQTQIYNRVTLNTDQTVSGLKRITKKYTDLNDTDKTQYCATLYRVDGNTANAPVSDSGVVIETVASSGFRTQIFIANDPTASTWRRSFRSTIWTRWKKLLDSDDSGGGGGSLKVVELGILQENDDGGFSGSITQEVYNEISPGSVVKATLPNAYGSIVGLISEFVAMEQFHLFSATTGISINSQLTLFTIQVRNDLSVNIAPTYVKNDPGYHNPTVTIRTQAQFDALINDPDWGGGSGVIFDGAEVGGTGFVYRATQNKGIKVPGNILRIQGVNNAKIVVESFVYDSSIGNAAFWRELKTYNEDLYVRDLSVYCVPASVSEEGAVVFKNFRNMTGCMASANGDKGIMFDNCDNLINCTGKVGSAGTAFNFCTNLISCNGSGRFGFYMCENLVNCTGTGLGQNLVGYEGRAFSYCKSLSNCTAHGINATAYGYSNCSYCATCRKSGYASFIALWAGNNSKISVDTCDTNDDGTIPGVS